MTSLSQMPWNQIACVMVSLVLGACNTTCSGSFSAGSGEAIDKPVPSHMALNTLAGCIDGEQALAHVRQLVSFAPRDVGTAGNKATRDYIFSTLSDMGAVPQRHPFTALTPRADLKEVLMENMSVRFMGATKKRVLITGHYDGKRIDKGTFYGANDSGSSTGLLLELARCMLEYPPKETVELVFFDGEEALVTWTDSDSLYGSKRYVAELLEHNEAGQIAAVVNVDMVGDKRLAFVDEQNSTAWVFAALREAAQDTGNAALFTGVVASIADDHLPFVEAGIPAANLIDFSYGPGWHSNAYWHTEQDNMSHVSAQSLAATGQIVVTALPRLSKGR